MADLNAPVRPAAYVEERTEWQPHAGVVSWGAIFAGAVAAAAFGLILLTLGTGLGLAALSPWHSARDSAATFGFAAVVWVCVTQVLTSGLGGYLAGRLRHRWPTVDVDEVYFRDTAHGFVTWALATLATAALFAALLPAVGRAGAQAVQRAVPSAFALDRGDARAAADRWPVGYYVDSLFRLPVAASPSASATPPIAGASASEAASATAASATAASASNGSSDAASGVSAAPASGAPALHAAGNTTSGAVVSPVATPAIAATSNPESVPTATEPAAAGSPPKPEVTRIFLNSLATGDPLSSADTAYVASLVARYTGLTPQAAQARVSGTYEQLQQKVAAMQDDAKAAADHARRASISASLWLFVSLLMGAFAASFMAIFGGRMRDI